MNSAFTLAKKDIKLLLRDKSAMFWVLVFPLLVAILFGSIFGGSDSNAIEVALVDQDGSKESIGFVDRLKSSTALSIKNPAGNDPIEEVRRGNLSAYILIPKGYGEAARSMQYTKGPAIQVGIDPSKKAESGMLQGVVSEAAYKGMSEMFSQPTEMRGSVQEGLKSLQAKQKPEDAPTIRYLTELDRYLAGGGTVTGSDSNGFSFEGPKIEQVKVQAEGTQPASAFDLTFPQAILWGLLGVITTFAISMVKERQQGTLIRLRVSPMSFTQILGGKGLACFLACVGVMAVLLLVGMVAFKVRLQSPALLALAIVSSAFCLVGVMMLLSVLGRTEQAVAGSSWGVMILMAMFGGGMIPVFMMPPWMQAAGSFSPLKWTVISLEGALWRGFALRDMLLPCLLLVGIGVVCFGIGVQVLRKTATASG